VAHRASTDAFTDSRDDPAVLLWEKWRIHCAHILLFFAGSPDNNFVSARLADRPTADFGHLSARYWMLASRTPDGIFHIGMQQFQLLVLKFIGFARKTPSFRAGRMSVWIVHNSHHRSVGIAQFPIEPDIANSAGQLSNASGRCDVSTRKQPDTFFSNHLTQALQIALALFVRQSIFKSSIILWIRLDKTRQQAICVVTP
jgi:hypothetical protein